MKTHIRLDADGESHKINEDKKSIVLNGTEHILSDDVWDFMWCLESEKEYFRKKYMELFYGDKT